jgi:hypothetical protein
MGDLNFSSYEVNPATTPIPAAGWLVAKTSSGESIGIEPESFVRVEGTVVPTSKLTVGSTVRIKYYLDYSAESFHFINTLPGDREQEVDRFVFYKELYIVDIFSAIVGYLVHHLVRSPNNGGEQPVSEDCICPAFSSCGLSLGQASVSVSVTESTS